MCQLLLLLSVPLTLLQHSMGLIMRPQASVTSVFQHSRGRNFLPILIDEALHRRSEPEN